uniref:Fibrinogen C-terminal domain-containing protein n=1 Tax=Scophthalmus maximus TaxID=52904 RepID=A0A8D3B4J9_SCOMX
KCCSFLLWFAVVLVVIAAVVTVTVTILYLNQYPLPFISRGGVSSSPVISTNPRESGALVTVSRVTAGEPISIFLDPNCPDHSEIFLRWEELQSSLLRALTNHNTGDWQERGLVQRLGEELKVLSGHAHNMRVEADSLKRGQGVLDQRLDELQREQSRTLQLQSDAHSAVLKLAAGFSDSLLGLQRETESLRRLKGELQTHNKNTALRPRHCSDVMASGVSQDGVYSVFPTHNPDGFMVYCDMTTDGGGWTVIQRREDGSVNFFRGWEAYRDGFGTTTGEHWLGDTHTHTQTHTHTCLADRGPLTSDLSRRLPLEALWHEVHHQRPGPRPVGEQLCSVLPGGVVVPQLPHLQPEWAVPERRPHLLRRRGGVVQLDRLAILTPVH